MKLTKLDFNKIIKYTCITLIVLILTSMAGLIIFVFNHNPSKIKVTKAKFYYTNTIPNLVTKKPKRINAFVKSDIQDLIPPTIALVSDELNTITSDLEIKFASNEKIAKALRGDNEQSFDLTDSTDPFIYSTVIRDLKVGENEIVLTFLDLNNNSSTLEFTIVRNAPSLPALSYTPPTNEKITYDGNDLLALVNKEWALPQDFVPDSLVSLSDQGVPVTNGSMQLRLIAATSLKQMVDDAKAQGLDLRVLSAYRSYETQIYTYNYWVKTVGQYQADRASARPGHSEHQLGTTVDFTSSEIGNGLSSNFGLTNAGKWVAENAYKYGFAMSYPPGSESVTGYKYEPWHFRYIGVDAATEVNSRGIVLEEYLRGQN